MKSEAKIRQGQSCASDAREAAREFHAAVAQDNPTLVVFFCSSEYALDALADEINRLFAGVPVVGCTTAGEIRAGRVSRPQSDGDELPRIQRAPRPSHGWIIWDASPWMPAKPRRRMLFFYLEARAPRAEPTRTASR